MERYDYSGVIEQSDKLISLVDTLNGTEITAAIQAISEAKQISLKKSEEQISQWFDAAILPILKEFAEMTASVLEIERPQNTYFIATLSHSQEFDITESCRAMRFILAFSNHIGINSTDGITTLTLIFDLAKLDR